MDITIKLNQLFINEITIFGQPPKAYYITKSEYNELLSIIGSLRVYTSTDFIKRNWLTHYNGIPVYIKEKKSKLPEWF